MLISKDGTYPSRCREEAFKLCRNVIRHKFTKRWELFFYKKKHRKDCLFQ